MTDVAGTCQNDFIMETCVGSAPEIIPPKASFRMQCDVIEWVCKNVPRWNPVSYNGYNLREAGTNAVGEVARRHRQCCCDCGGTDQKRDED